MSKQTVSSKSWVDHFMDYTSDQFKDFNQTTGTTFSNISDSISNTFLSQEKPDLSKGHQLVKKREKSKKELDRLELYCEGESEKKEKFLDLEAYFMQHDVYSKFVPTTDFKLGDDKQLILDYFTFSRFLESNNWDWFKTKSRIEGWIEWRLKAKPYLIKPEEVLGNQYWGLKSQVGYICGKDKKGRPISYVFADKHITYRRDLQGALRYTMFMLETGISYMKEDDDHYVLVYDISNISLDNFDAAIAAEYIALGKYYPNRIAQTIMFKPNSTWKSVWDLMKPFIEEKDIKKIVIVESDDELKKYIDEDQIPKLYGGKANFKPSVETFLKKYYDHKLLEPEYGDNVEEEEEEKQEENNFSETIVINAPIDKCFKILMDFDSYTEFLTNLSSVKSINKKDDYVDVEYNVSIGFFYFTYVLRHKKENNKLSWKMISGSTGLASNDGKWSLKKFDDNTTIATYTTNVQFSIWLPDTVIQSFIGKSLSKNLELFKKRIESSQ